MGDRSGRAGDSMRAAQAGCASWCLALLVLCGMGVLPANGHACASDGGSALLRMAFTSSMFAEVNESDARAAVKVWARAIIRDRGIAVDPETRILNGTEAIANALRSEQIDALALVTREYWTLGDELLTGPLVVGVNQGSITEEYVLLVHRDSGIERIGDLRGRTLLFHHNPRTSLAPAWLELLLVKNGFPRTDEYCSRVTPITKISQTVLPVFFRKSDACVVTRRGFQTMSELNPQVGRQLKVLTSSPQLVPNVFCFRKNYPDPDKDKLLAEIKRIHATPGGQQVLTIFQCERLEIHPVSCLNGAFEMLKEHRRLLGSGKSTRAVATGMKSSEAKGKQE